MENRLSRWGVGPRIVSLTLPHGIVAGIVTRIWPHVCRLRSIPGIVLVMLAVVLLANGLPMLLTTVISMNRAYNSDRLVTSGIFAVVRHPIYSAWIVLILPGLALLSRSWPLLLMSVVAYTVFKPWWLGHEHHRARAIADVVAAACLLDSVQFKSLQCAFPLARGLSG